MSAIRTVQHPGIDTDRVAFVADPASIALDHLVLSLLGIDSVFIIFCEVGGRFVYVSVGGKDISEIL
jgi:hypothetical protein